MSKMILRFFRLLQAVAAVLMILFFAFQAVRGFMGGFIVMGFGMVLLSVLGIVFLIFAYDEYKYGY